MKPVIRIVAGGLALLFAFTAIYVAAFHAPRPKGFDVGVVGGPADAMQLQSELDRGERGAFDVRGYATEREARTALFDTDVHAVVAGDRILVAQAFGAAPTDAATRALADAVPGATVADLRPLPPEDARGLSSLFVVVGTVIPSLVFGALLSVLGRALPARLRWAAVVAYAAGAGLVVAFNVDVLVGALEGHFVALAAVSALLALAVAAAAHGLGHLVGPPGIVAAILILLLLGISSAGGAVTYQFEPGFFGAVSQLLPPGAALTATRNVEYFDSAATLVPVLVLVAWAAAGLMFGLLGERYGRWGRGAGPNQKGRLA
jgi:hypothetical protein